MRQRMLMAPCKRAPSLAAKGTTASMTSKPQPIYRDQKKKIAIGLQFR